MTETKAKKLEILEKEYKDNQPKRKFFRALFYIFLIVTISYYIILSYLSLSISLIPVSFMILSLFFISIYRVKMWKKLCDLRRDMNAAKYGYDWRHQVDPNTGKLRCPSAQAELERSGGK